jgi:hypothetical protein
MAPAAPWSRISRTNDPAATAITRKSHFNHAYGADPIAVPMPHFQMSNHDGWNFRKVHL